MGFYKGPKQSATMTKLTGTALLAHREACRAAGVGNVAIVRSAGYIGTRKDGTERLNFTEYYENILIAQGRMFRIKIDVAEFTPMGVQPVWSDSFTVDSKSHRSIARKVRERTKLTGVKCTRTVKDGVAVLYPRGTNEMVAYTLPA
jgi:hypothetical protein